MRWVYVWWGDTEGPFEFSGGKRPPDELYVEEAARDLGIEMIRSSYSDSELPPKVAEAKPDVVLFSHPRPGFGKEQVEALRQAAPKAVFALLCFDLTTFKFDKGRIDRYIDLLPHLDVLCAKEAGNAPLWKREGVLLRRAVQGYHPWMEKVWTRGDEYDDRPVLFCGSYTERRDQVLSKVQNVIGDSLEVHSQTGGWRLTKNVQGPLFGPDLNKRLGEVSCALDIVNGKVIGYHSDRVEDTLAAGVPLLAETIPEPHMDFRNREHLVYWGMPDNIPWWIEKIRNEPAFARKLSEAGSERVRSHYSYRDTVRDVMTACDDVRERRNQLHITNDGSRPKRNHVLVWGQWRAQGLGYMAKRIVEVVESHGGQVKVASINRNPEWDEEHRYDSEALPPENTHSIIFLEKANDYWLEWAKGRGVQTVHFPMWEFWGEAPRKEADWGRACDIVTAVPWEALEKALGRPVRPLVWDPGIPPRRPVYQPVVTFYHDARGIEQGKYDMRPRQHTNEVLAAYTEAHGRLVKLGREVKLVLRIKNNEIPEEPPATIQISNETSRDHLFQIIRECSVAICPSGPEGLGLPPYEFQALSVPPIVLDVLPACVVVRDGIDGWLVAERATGQSRGLAQDWFPDHDSLVRAIMAASDPVSVNMVKQGAYEAAVARHKSFDRFLLDLLNE